MIKQTAQSPQASEEQKKKLLKNVLYVTLIIFLLLLAAGGVFAKYVYSNVDTGTVLAREFYFTSDQLTTSGTTYILNPGTTSFTFNLKNYADDLRFSSDDIVYTIETTGGTLSAGDVVIQSGIAQTDTPLKSNAKSSVSIKLSGLLDGQSYTITATGTAGYKETLTATFTVLSAGSGVYKHLDISNPAYVILTVWTENVTGDLNIAFPAGLIPDATDPVLDDVENYSTASGTGNYISGSLSDEKNKTDEASFLNPYSSRTYRFFKATTTDNFTVDDFTVTLDINDETILTATTDTP